MDATNKIHCFACGKVIHGTANKADTRDGQWVYVGRECAKRINKAGDIGYQPAQGGPKLYPMGKE